MRSNLPKVLHPVAGVPMVKHVIRSARGAGVSRLVLVVGHGRDLLMERITGDDIDFAIQEQQLGTGHALLQARDHIGQADIILVLCGDTPLLKSTTLTNLIEYHQENQSAATVLTACVGDPTGYGRIIRDQEDQFVRIVEEKDAAADEKKIHEINSGIYCFRRDVFDALQKLTPNNAQGEYYLTDVLIGLRGQGKKVMALMAAEEEDIYGINDRVQLSFAEQVMRRRKTRELMLSGVTVVDPDTTFVDLEVSIGPDSVVYPFSIIEGNTTIGEECTIGPGAQIVDSSIGSGVSIVNSRILSSIIGDNCTIGPFSYIRPDTVLAQDVKVGDFVEIKKSNIGLGSKVPHLSYVGDAEIGRGVNIGAGTITCNYDGVNKYPTIIEDEVFIGSNTNLVAPVKIGSGATTGAGSTITRDLPPNSLGVERAPQKVIADWRNRKNHKKSE